MPKARQVQDFLYFIGRSFYDIFFKEVLTALASLKRNYAINRTKVLVVTIFSLLILILTFYFVSELLFKPVFTSQESPSQNTIQPLPPMGQVTDSEPEVQTGVVGDFIESYESTIKILKPVLDGFVGTTPDVTGLSGTEDQNKTKFYNGSEVISAKAFYDKTYGVTILLFVLLFVAKGINLTFDPEPSVKGTITEIGIRFLITVVLLIGGRYFMSYSIQLTNEINEFFRGGTSLTDYLLGMTDAVKVELTKAQPQSLVDNLRNVLSLGFSGWIRSLPILLPLVLIILLLLFISFQFIVRWVTLYFLVPLQPLAAVFYFSRRTSGINESFWKTWFTLLIHQPFFVLGYTMLQGILLENLKSGPTFESILIFLATLIFLSSVNVLVGRIFGDSWTAISANLQAGTASGIAGGLLGKVIHPANEFKRGIVGGNTNSLSGLTGRTLGRRLSLIRGNSQSEQNTKRLTLNTSTPILESANSARKSGKGTRKGIEHKTLSDPLKSIHAKSLVSSGYTVNNEKKGLLGVKGAFYGGKSINGVTTLYTTKQDALDDGIKENEVQKYSLNDGRIFDTSNFKQKSIYNSTLGKLAKDKGHKGNVHLKSNSSPDRIISALDLAREHNKSNKINGIVINRIGKNTPKSDNPKKQLQIYVYDEVLNKNND